MRLCKETPQNMPPGVISVHPHTHCSSDKQQDRSVVARDAMSTEMRACSGFDSHSARAASGSELVSMSSRQSSWSSTSHGLTAAVYISAARLWGVLVSERTKNAGRQARDSCLGEGVRGSVHERGRSRRSVEVSSCPGQQRAKSPGPQPVGLEAQQRRRRALSMRRLREAAAETPGAHLLACQLPLLQATPNSAQSCPSGQPGRK